MEELFSLFTMQIARCSRYIRKIKQEEMDNFDLKGPHVSCLYYLYKNDGSLTLKELCDICDEDKAYISRAVDSLEKDGYIECNSKAEKRYKSPLFLTEKGGRISATTAFFGEMLSIKPIIGGINGKVEVISKVKGNKKGNQYLISKVEELGGINFDMPYGLLYSGNEKTNINKFTEECEYLFANIKPNSHCLGCTIGTHIGPGAVGLAFFSK